jgi:PAS domain S-box-containing protein
MEFDDENIEKLFDEKVGNDARGIIAVDYKGCVTRSNAFIDDFLGYEKGTINGLNFINFVHEEAAPKGFDLPIALHYFEHSKDLPMDIKLLHKGGHQVPVQISSKVIKNEEGEIEFCIGTIEPLVGEKGKKLLDQKAWEDSEMLQNILTNTGDAILVADANSKIIMANKVMLQMLGYVEDEFIGTHLLEHSATEEGEYETVIGEKVNIGEEFFTEQISLVNRLFEEGRISGHEFYLKRKDDKLIITEATMSILKEQNGARRGTVSIFRDISERKEADKKIRGARDFLENLFKTSTDAIIVADPVGAISMVNDATEQMLGYSRDELIGKQVGFIMPPDKRIREEMMKQLEKSFEKGSGYGIETVFQRKDGENIFVEINHSLLKDKDGDWLGGVNIVRDITERKKIEKLLIQTEKLKSLGELAGGVAHDFNNVLAAIVGRVQMLQRTLEKSPEKLKDKDVAKDLKIIEKAAMDGAETVRRIQGFSRKRDEEMFFPVDINEIVNDAIEYTKVRWKDNAELKGVSINVNLKSSELPSISGNPSELREVFTNIINNSIDAMPEGGDIIINTVKKEECVLVQVKDTGVGVQEAVKDRIFDPFFTLKGSKSSGLGLSVSYGIVCRHEGSISVDSAEGEGTVFTVEFPVALEPHVQKDPSIEGIDTDIKAKILVVDDDDEVRDVFSDILATAGHDVETAPDGMQGLEVFDKEKFDLVFTDLGMPGMSGWEVAREIKNRNKNVPVALITGWEVKIKEDEIKKRGVDFLISKPFVVARVLRLVQECMALNGKL